MKKLITILAILATAASAFATGIAAQDTLASYTGTNAYGDNVFVAVLQDTAGYHIEEAILRNSCDSALDCTPFTLGSIYLGNDFNDLWSAMSNAEDFHANLTLDHIIFHTAGDTYLHIFRHAGDQAVFISDGTASYSELPLPLVRDILERLE